MSAEQQDKETKATPSEAAESYAPEESEGEVSYSEPKKPINRSALVLFALVIAGAGGTYFMYLRSGPQAASAASTQTQDAQKTISQFLDSGTQNIRSMEDSLRATDLVVQRFLNYPSVTQIPLEALQTNPFRSPNAGGDGSGDGAASQKQKEAQLAAIRKAVGALQLQSIVRTGKTKACMINNTLYQEGQQVDVFTIETINPQSVVVRSGVYRAELKMQR